jgi:hypothetical protein
MGIQGLCWGCQQQRTNRQDEGHPQRCSIQKSCYHCQRMNHLMKAT